MVYFTKNSEKIELKKFFGKTLHEKTVKAAGLKLSVFCDHDHD
jgi:hypothetical protein